MFENLQRQRELRRQAIESLKLWLLVALGVIMATMALFGVTQFAYAYGITGIALAFCLPEPADSQPFGAFLRTPLLMLYAAFWPLCMTAKRLMQWWHNRHVMALYAPTI